jgi:hypothetical protein
VLVDYEIYNMYKKETYNLFFGTTEIITDEIANPNDHDRLYCTVLPLPAAQHSIPQIPDITKK